MFLFIIIVWNYLSSHVYWWWSMLLSLHRAETFSVLINLRELMSEWHFTKCVALRELDHISFSVATLSILITKRTLPNYYKDFPSSIFINLSTSVPYSSCFPLFFSVSSQTLADISLYTSFKSTWNITNPNNFSWDGYHQDLSNLYL